MLAPTQPPAHALENRRAVLLRQQGELFLTADVGGVGTACDPMGEVGRCHERQSEHLTADVGSVQTASERRGDVERCHERRQFHVDAKCKMCTAVL